MNERRGGGAWRGAVLAVALVAAGAPARGQELADFDYENLSFRGIGLEVGRIFPDRVEPDLSVGMRLDLGYLGPGVRITPSVSYWSSRMKDREVRKLEDRVAQLVDEQSPEGTPPAQVDLGVIEWSDLVLGLDGHVVWSVPLGVLTYLGAGASAHIMNGDGSAVNGTFVEDLLDTVTAGFNVHTGLEYPVTERLRLYGTARYELMGDVRYGELRIGTQFMFGPAAPGEGGR